MNQSSKAAESERACPACGSRFEVKRSDQIYCTSKCRKNSFSRKDRKENPRNSRYSPTKWRENYDLLERNRRLVELYAKQKNVDGRESVIEQVISAAENGHGQLRSLLTNEKFLRPKRTQSLLSCPGYEPFGTIAQIANRYSWTKWGCSISEALKHS